MVETLPRVYQWGIGCVTQWHMPRIPQRGAGKLLLEYLPKHLGGHGFHPNTTIFFFFLIH